MTRPPHERDARASWRWQSASVRSSTQATALLERQHSLLLSRRQRAFRYPLARCPLGTYESAQAACRPTSPDRADYLALRARGLSHTRASLTMARKLARRCFHTLRELGPDALEPLA